MRSLLSVDPFHARPVLLFWGGIPSPTQGLRAACRRLRSLCFSPRPSSPVTVTLSSATSSG